MLGIWLNRQSACLPERRKVSRNAAPLLQHAQWHELGRRSRAGFRLIPGHRGEPVPCVTYSSPSATRNQRFSAVLHLLSCDTEPAGMYSACIYIKYMYLHNTLYTHGQFSPSNPPQAIGAFISCPVVSRFSPLSAR